MRWFQGRSRRASAARGDSAVWRRALRASLDGDLERVAEQLTSLVERDSGDVEAFIVLGRVCRQGGDAGRAVAIHQALVVRRDLTRDERVEALAELGQSLHAAGEPRRALAAFEEVMVHDRRQLAALRGMEGVLRDLGEWSRALAVMRRRGRVEGRRDRAAEAGLLAEMAREAAARGDAARARRVVRRALRRDRDCADALELAGELAGRTERPPADPAARPSTEAARAAAGDG